MEYWDLLRRNYKNKSAPGPTQYLVQRATRAKHANQNIDAKREELAKREIQHVQSERSTLSELTKAQVHFNKQVYKGSSPLQQRRVRPRETTHTESQSILTTT